MPTTRLSDVVIPAAFSGYVIQETMTKSALVESGAMTRNGVIEAQLRAGSDFFSVPSWNDIGGEPNAVNDDPEQFAVPQKITAFRQRVRKFYAHNSWSSMNFASELAGSDAVAVIQTRLTDYWRRVLQARTVATLQGIMAANIGNNAGDMVHDISGLAGDAASFNDDSFITAASTLGDAMNDVRLVLMHSHVYTRALKNGDVVFIPADPTRLVPTYRGCAVIVDDSMPVSNGNYITALVGNGVLAYGMAAPVIADAIEVENVPSAGNGGGMQVLHSRLNIAAHVNGFDWLEGSLVEASPTLADLRGAAHWNRVVERKAVPIAFLLTK